MWKFEQTEFAAFNDHPKENIARMREQLYTVSANAQKQSFRPEADPTTAVRDEECLHPSGIDTTLLPEVKRVRWN